jgi:hypothetical protein
VQIVDNNSPNNISKFDQILLLRSTVINFQSIYFALNKAKLRRRAPIGYCAVEKAALTSFLRQEFRPFSTKDCMCEHIVQEQTFFFFYLQLQELLSIYILFFEMKYLLQFLNEKTTKLKENFVCV